MPDVLGMQYEAVKSEGPDMTSSTAKPPTSLRVKKWTIRLVALVGFLILAVFGIDFVTERMAKAEEGVFTTAAISSQMPTNVAQPGSSEDTLTRFISLLEKGRKNTLRMEAFQVEFDKQERIDGYLKDRQIIDMTVRREPFGVAMTWKTGSKGRALKFLPDQNGGKALVRLGGLKGRLLGTVKIEPDGSRAYSDSRHAINEAGILSVIDSVLSRAKSDVGNSGATYATLGEQEMHETKCSCFRVSYKDPEGNEDFRQGIVFLDPETSIPVRVASYTWAVDVEELTVEELDTMTLLEDYSFRNLKPLSSEESGKLIDEVL